MRVLMISKACVVGAYQSKLEEIAAHPDIALTVAVPPEWRDERGTLKLERVSTQGYELVVEPIRFNGSFHLHYYPHVEKLMTRIKPDLVHIDEEPYNLATWHALHAARRHHAKALFFSWQNLNRRYPFPFNLLESDVLRHTDYAICGNQASTQVWRAKGFTKSIAIIPQFGIDPNLFSPPLPPPPTHPFTICYAGRFVPEKGPELLIRACAKLEGDYRLILLGAGPQREALIQLATALGVGDRLTVQPWMPSTKFPNFLHTIDTLVLPSISKPNWIEQFGRVLVEAMACGVPVVGSTCGEIPNVIGEAGLIFPERDVAALTQTLCRLQADPQLRIELQTKGRQRVLERFTQKRIAEETVKVYRDMLVI
jgi:glycosyltransferase involved in cell wall biosynthesis